MRIFTFESIKFHNNNTKLENVFCFSNCNGHGSEGPCAVLCMHVFVLHRALLCHHIMFYSCIISIYSVDWKNKNQKHFTVNRKANSCIERSINYSIRRLLIRKFNCSSKDYRLEVLHCRLRDKSQNWVPSSPAWSYQRSSFYYSHQPIHPLRSANLIYPH